MIFKTLVEQLFIKEYYFQMQKVIFGHQLKLLCQHGITKHDFDKDSVLERFEHQLKNSRN